ncbi:MAG: RecQ family ATP-dependent DNA helicase [Okeania sp. SIO3B5]|uniref:RecQ family ATP-dependent DNA helicase n=1 Tax=Okeania sp. SIO3B5 TaxID=2607811 RepID=UPI0013FFBDDE|nr:RecQ family ATP-dependent DNA helicase [Okeania sp. SIO3B5]NEO53950.1 RecQ family ATP-dependent DNA helicase [Okeania sp. SIO3B5]
MDINQQRALSLLRTALNNSTAEFRDGQWEAIKAITENQSRLLVVQRTGWGKSFVYFLATRLLRDEGKGITLLISPLLALMRNQISTAKRIGIRAKTINSSNSKEWAEVENDLRSGEVDILLISPERLANEDFRENILIPIAKNIGLFVVDEAHCISDWGHDFRPDYRRIVRILQALPKNIPVLATTATANNRVVDDIAVQLGTNLKIFRGSLTRDSLQLQNIYLPFPPARLGWLAEHLPNIPGSGIIYTLTIRDAEIVSKWLKSQEINVAAYHSRKDTAEREELEEQLLNNEIKALVATVALGMGFDKPDLGFVIHYQRPGSVVHYYQQVGRAGRAVENAYGILLSGEEDEEITDYFIQTAFPPEAHNQAVLAALNQSEDGLSVPMLEQYLNLTNGQINKVLKLLSIETPSPVKKIGSKYYATPINYQSDTEKIEKLTQIRYQEQARMRDYMQSRECLMQFLRKELDDPNPNPCGKCAICLGKSIFSENVSSKFVTEAVQFLRSSEQIIEPRKKWPKNALSIYNFNGNISQDLKAEIGRSLSLWNDAGWGELVKKGKYQDNNFNDRLVGATYNMIQRWQPQPFPTWVTCIPSLNRPELVPNFAQSLAEKLGLPFVPCIIKIRHTSLQKDMSNSYKQAHNLDGAFKINNWEGISGNVFLVDDVVDSRWTFTVVTALLRNAGSGQIFPLALAMNQL